MKTLKDCYIRLGGLVEILKLSLNLTIVTLCSAIVTPPAQPLGVEKHQSMSANRTPVYQDLISSTEIAQVGSASATKGEVRGCFRGQGAVGKGSLQGQSQFYFCRATRLISP